MKILNRFLKISFSVLFVFSSTIASAQSGGDAGAFSRIGFGPRGLAMGNALTSITKEGAFSYYNPAVAAFAEEGNQVDLSTAAMSFDRSLNTVNATFRLPPTAGLTFSLINANVDNIDGRSVSGYDTGTLETHEYQFAVSLGRKVTNKLSAGVGFKYYISDLHSDLPSAKTAGLDFGLLYKFSSRLNIGITVQDLLASYTWSSGSLYGDDSSNRIDEFPTRFRVGTSYDLNKDWLLSIEGGHMIHQNISTNSLRVGSSYILHERITVRAGWQIDELSSVKTSNHGSAGFSVHLPFDLFAPSVDYALVQEANNRSYMHSFGLQLNL